MTTIALYIVILVNVAAAALVLWWALNRLVGAFIAVAAALDRRWRR